MKETYIFKLALIRHGKTKGNEEGKYLGTTDEDLSVYGRDCIASLRKKNIYPVCDMYFSSPRKRCRQTLDIITRGCGETAASDKEEASEGRISTVIIDDFAELSFGPFENKNYGQLKHDEDYRTWIDSSGETCPKGCEKKSDFVIRNRRGLLTLANEAYQKKAETVMLLAHAGTAMALISSYTGADYYENIPGNGEGYLLEVNCETDDGKVDNISQLGILGRICP